jgi:hypothetical protein
LTTFAAVGRLSHIDCRTGPTTVEALVVAGGGTGETSPELSRIAVDRACIAIARRQWEALRLRALLVCIGLQSAQLSALEMCEILANAFAPLELLVPFHKVWAIATTVKHFPR